MLNRVYVLIKQLVALGGLSAGIGEADLTERSKAHFASLAAEGVPEQPGFGVLAGNLQIKPGAIRIHARRFELLHLRRSELVDGLCH